MGIGCSFKMHFTYTPVVIIYIKKMKKTEHLIEEDTITYETMLKTLLLDRNAVR